MPGSELDEKETLGYTELVEAGARKSSTAEAAENTAIDPRLVDEEGQGALGPFLRSFGSETTIKLLRLKQRSWLSRDPGLDHWLHPSSLYRAAFGRPLVSGRTASSAPARMGWPRLWHWRLLFVGGDGAWSNWLSCWRDGQGMSNGMLLISHPSGGFL